MDFNFYEIFRSKPTVELLKMLRQKEKYQSAALEAAKIILQEREVSEDDRAIVENYFQDLENRQRQRQKALNDLKNSATDFIQPIIQPDAKVEPHKWLKILLAVIVIQYLWSFYQSIKEFVQYLNCFNCKLDIGIFTSFINLVYTPVLFYLLFKKRRWGWILLFADNLFVFISSISDIYIFFKYQDLHQGNTGVFLFSIFLRGCFAYFLWQPEIASFFNVTLKIKQRTVLITISLMVLVFISFM